MIHWIMEFIGWAITFGAAVLVLAWFHDWIAQFFERRKITHERIENLHERVRVLERDRPANRRRA